MILVNTCVHACVQGTVEVFEQKALQWQINCAVKWQRFSDYAYFACTCRGEVRA